MIEVSPIAKAFNSLFPGREGNLDRKLYKLAQRGTAGVFGGTEEALWNKMYRLLRSGANVNAVTHDGGTILGTICGQGLPLVARHLVEDAGADVNRGNSKGTMPLKMAAWAADAQTMQMLLDHGADATAKNSDGADAVYDILHSGREDARKNPANQGECLKILNAHGAVDAAAKFFVFKERPELAFAIPEVADAKAMAAAGENRDMKAVQALVDRGVSPDLPCRFATNPPLFYAAKNGDMDMIALLRKAGANPREGHPVLLLAAAYAQREAFEALLDMGADFKATFPGNGKTIFDFARESTDSGMETFIHDVLTKRATPETVLTKEMTVMPRLKLKNTSTPG